MNAWQQALITVFSGIITAALVAGIPIWLRHRYNLATKREDEGERIANNLEFAIHFNSRLYDRYDQYYAGLKWIERDLDAWKKNHPDIPLTEWMVTIRNLCLLSRIENELQARLEYQESQRQPKRREQDES